MRIVDRVSAASFIGREPELAELEASLADAASGQPRLVFVAGESGVGKSRLASEFEDRAAARGARVIGGECIELGEDELPYAPLVGAVRPLVRDDDPAFEELPEGVRAELARLAPELGEPAAVRTEDREGEAQRRLFDSLLSLLERLGSDGPVVFWLEDLHWADRSTRSFLAFLSSSLRDERVLVLSTYRSDELHRRHPLRPLLNELERGPCARRLELRPFDREELAEQLSDILGDAPSEEVAERLFARSGGNPLFTEELLAAGLDGRGSLPPTLREALLTRLERIAPESRRVLDVLSVAGRADDAVLTAAGDLDPGALRSGLREAIAAHVIRTDDAGRFQFRHALFREVLYDDLLPSERSELHLAFAHALSDRFEHEPGTWLSTAIAHHFHKAGDQGEALRSAVVAGEHAEAVHAHGEAAALFDRALGFWPRVADAEELAGQPRAELLARAAHAYRMSGDDLRATTLLEHALEEVDVAESPLRAARFLGELADSQWTLGQAERSRATLARAVELVPEEATEEGAWLLAHEVRFRLLQGRFAEVEELATRAIAMCDELGLDEVKAGVLHRFGTALITVGDDERGVAICLEAIELAHRSAPSELGPAYLNYADAVHLVGRSAEAAEIMERAAPEIVDTDRSGPWLALQRAEVAFELGDWDWAAALLPSDRGLSGSSLVHLQLRRAEQALGRGDLSAARPELEAAQDGLAGSVEPQYIAAAAVLRADLELRERNLAAARAAVDDALDRIEFCTEDTARLARIAATGVEVEAGAAIDARDVGDPDGERQALARAESMHARAEAGAEETANPVMEARLAFASAQLARAGASPEAPELWRRTADAWDSLQRPYARARALWRLAESVVDGERRDEAAEAARTAHEIARRIGAEWLALELESLAARARLALAAEPEPTSPAAVEDPFGLTERERQVLVLVAAGATNREIGAELFMAEKTASVHVSRILGKLGVRSRTEAAAVAHRQGLAETVDA